MAKHMLAFVDDKRHYVNSLPTQSNKNILTAMELSVSSWNELLHFVGGALETSNNNVEQNKLPHSR